MPIPAVQIVGTAPAGVKKGLAGQLTDGAGEVSRTGPSRV